MKAFPFRSPKPAVALLAAALLAGCASDPLTTSVSSGPAHVPATAGPEQIPALLRVAQSTAAAGDYASAISFFRRAHALDPHHFEAALGLAKALSAAGARNEAIETYKHALAIRPQDSEARHGLGIALIAVGRPQAAITQLEAALELKDDPRSYSALGVAYDHAGQHKAAQALYRTGLRLAPDDLSLLNNLGLSLTFGGDYREAIETLRRVAGDPRATARHRQNLALAYGLSGQTETAEQIARVDLDETAVRRNIGFYRTLRALADTRAATEAVGAHIQGVAFQAMVPPAAR